MKILQKPGQLFFFYFRMKMRVCGGGGKAPRRLRDDGWRAARSLRYEERARSPRVVVCSLTNTEDAAKCRVLNTKLVRKQGLELCPRQEKENALGQRGFHTKNIEKIVPERVFHIQTLSFTYKRYEKHSKKPGNYFSNCA